ncbi:MAG: aminotransferase class V-fold PLP-dependent enzyme [Thermodesulfobacteriota bacterium]
MPPTIARAQGLWSPERVYLNTASYGLPPRPAWDALQAVLADWRAGRTSWERWGDATEGARAVFAELVGVDVATVATGATVSGLVGLIAASIPDGARVLAPDIEFTSDLFPFLVQAKRGVTVRTVPPSVLVDEIDAGTDVVVASAVQMATGEVLDLEALEAAASRHDVTTVIDVTQACGWLPIDASRFDAVVCAAYKWLMSPRGTAFMSVRPRLLERIVPHAAGWYAGEDPHQTYFGGPLRLARTARRLDVSPAWFSWVGALPALELVREIGVPAIHQHDLRLANRFRAGLGLPPSDSAIVCVDAPQAADELERAGIMAAVRGGRLRTSWHVYNTDADVDATLEALSG